MSNATPVTLTTAAFTATRQTSFLSPSVVVTVMFAVPAFTAVTFPDLSTDAMAASELLHDTLGSVAFAGVTVAVN